MSVFKKLRNFLRKKETRAGLAGLGAVAGFGGFEGMKYGEKRGVVEFEPTDSAAEKIEYIYKLLVHDKVIQPIPQEQISQVTMKHKLAIWASKLK